MEPQFRVLQAKSPDESVELWYWKLVAANGEILCASEIYPSESNAWRGAETAKRNAAEAEIVQFTVPEGNTE